MNNKISFASDYEEGAHPEIIANLERTNFLKTSGYGTDEFSESARRKIRAACKAPDAEIFFLVGGTKCGAYFGEAVVLRKNFIPHFFTIIKQRGALLAKGRILGVQFDTLFTDDLYFKIGRQAIEAAEKIRGE